MKILIRNTDEVVTVEGGGRARVWTGHTDSGIPVIALVARLAVERGEDQTRFEQELRVAEPPAAVDASGPGPDGPGVRIDITDERAIAALRQLAGLEGLDLRWSLPRVGPLTAWTLLQAVQLTTTHPGVPAGVVDQLVDVGRRLQTLFNDYPELVELAERGWERDHPDHLVPDPVDDHEYERAYDDRAGEVDR